MVWPSCLKMKWRYQYHISTSILFITNLKDLFSKIFNTQGLYLNILSKFIFKLGHIQLPVTEMVYLLFQPPLCLVLLCQVVMLYRDEEKLEMLSGILHLPFLSVYT